METIFMSSETRTRYAPSPTGYMHIGNLRTALYEYLIAKKSRGKFILRIEDTDQERYVEGAVDVIYKTLKMAGLQHDEGPDIGGPFCPYTQSDRKPLYMEYAKKLVELGGAYYCFCSRERLAATKEKAEASGQAYKYDRHCLGLSKDEIAAKLKDNQPFVIRQKMPDTGSTSFEDVVYGTITVENSALEDQVLIKSDGLPTYNFANVVDDHLMEITHVVRGNEYLSSAPKYNLLYESFGWKVPTYVHVSMIVKPSGQKLSKRSGDPSFEDLVSMGYLIEAVVNFVALLGWSPGSTQEIFTMKELEEVFDIKGISKSPAVFDINKLNWMNGEYIRKMAPEEFHRIALPYMEKVITNKNIRLEKLSALLQLRTEVLTTISASVDFIEALPDYDIAMFEHKKMKTDRENSLENLKAALKVLEEINEWDNRTIYGKLMELVQQLEVKNSQILWPVRTAISGKDVTPGGATEIAEILGKEETLRRIQMGIVKLEAAQG
ncbi:MAG: Glutamate-tRNA ligase [candidate division CPR2 bacterium GW2011_GWD2_39_7]|nr:MAG: Glutamate-tRNA ligase [candidate division CPR2 bacterium GW2011_GWD2_39_7]